MSTNARLPDKTDHQIQHCVGVIGFDDGCRVRGVGVVRGLTGHFLRYAEKGAAVNLKDEKDNATHWNGRFTDGASLLCPASGRHHEVVARLVSAGAHVDPAMLKSSKVLADAAMLSALKNG